MLSMRRWGGCPRAAAPPLAAGSWQRPSSRAPPMGDACGQARVSTLQEMAPTRLAPLALAKAEHACEAARMTTSPARGTGDGGVGTRQEGHRAPALRARRLVGRDCEITEVIERI